MNTIFISVNGEARAVPQGSNLADLVAALNVAPNALATAVNQQFVAREARVNFVLKAGDALTTFQAIVGG
jgi:sulfur carrier protein